MRGDDSVGPKPERNASLDRQIKKIGSYEITDRVGQGGMAVVYKALQPSLNRPVAIKVLSQKLARAREMVERFNRESLIIARLTHPNIIHVIDRGITHNGMPFFVMDFVEGTTLAKRVGEPGFDLNKKLDILVQICKALGYAHKNGVIHRDVKPANILIDVEGNALVSDFGIAQFYGDGVKQEDRTEEGVVMGTLAYMSPEQKLGSRDVTAASDLYSLGVIAYELMTATKPLGRFKPPSSIDPGVPPLLEEVILKCLETDPKDRYASAEEVRDRLLKLLGGAHLHEARKEEALQSVPESRFVLVDVIKEDRYGAVYLVEDKSDNHLMVVKKVRRPRRQFLDRAVLTSRRHENLVAVYGVSEDAKYRSLVMEYVSGGNLKERLVKGHPWPEVLQIARQICAGLAFAHRNGAIHGNLRPSNVLITESGQVKIGDFGLEEHYQDRPSAENWYASPGEKRSHQADLYAVGVIMYEMLTGTLPIWRQGKPVRGEEVKFLPLDLWEMLSKLLVRDRDQRYRSAEQPMAVMEALLLGVEDDPSTLIRSGHSLPRTRRRVFILAAVLMLLAAAGALAYLAFPDRMARYVEDAVAWIQDLKR